ncbi:NAD(P)-dependent oxidoreductase [Brevibacterium linens]|uniref:NAD(P)-dependent oxidoreductase n=1 Tax=Brevibacterium linens TaxID=1703 RepID=UPI003BF4CB63
MVFGCSNDEALIFRELGARFGISPMIVEDPVGESNADLARGTRCISVSHKTPITNRTLVALRNVGVEHISTRSIGSNHIDVAFAERAGISVETVSYSPDSVADYTLMLMLMALRHAKSTVRRTDAHDYRLDEVRGRELRDLTVGVIGTGRIGTAVVNRLRGFGCHVLGIDRQSRSATAGTDIDDLIEHSDIVTLHTPLTLQTHHLLNRQRIERMRPGAIVVNTGRGPLLDTEALLSALESGQLGGAALDVIEGEEGIFYSDHRDQPLANEALVRLQRLSNVLISPHSGYYTDHALRDLVENSIINYLKFESRKSS